MQGCVCPHPPLLIPAIGGENQGVAAIEYGKGRKRVKTRIEGAER